jgi:hypothetical protein
MVAGLGIKFAGDALKRALGPMLKKAGPRAKNILAQSVPFMAEADRLNPTWGSVGKAIGLGAIPELAFSAMGAASLPEGTPLGERVGSALWNGAIDSALGTFGDVGIGYGARRAGLGQQAAQLTQMAAMPLVYTIGRGIPRPFDNNAWGRAEKEQQAQQVQLREMEDNQLIDAVRNGAIEELLGRQRQGEGMAAFGWQQ